MKIIFLLIFLLFTGCIKFYTKKMNTILINPVITENITWQDEIIIKGIAVVKKGVTLKILPGTKIKFIKIDLNNDFIGDGELVIEGNLIAQGTKNNPIIFTSNEKNPKEFDWTYIYLERNQNFLVEYCFVSYAFTGLQIHYSEGVIRNNIFENNNEGLRYSTIKGIIQNNIFKKNNYGIRFESRLSDVEISYNEITKNKYGIFSVMRSIKQENKIINNNIYDNSKYNFLVGIEQHEDIAAANNWWGTNDKEKIESLIFDKNDDQNVGLLEFEPFLNEKVRNAGIK